MQNTLYGTLPLRLNRGCTARPGRRTYAEPQPRAALAGPPDRSGHRHDLEPRPRAKLKLISGLLRPRSSGRLHSHREHKDLDGGEKVLGLERCGRASTRHEPMYSSSVTIVESSVMSGSAQPAQEAAMQRGVSTQDGKGVRAGREAHARSHPAGKPGSKVRRRGRRAHHHALEAAMRRSRATVAHEPTPASFP